ETGIFSLEALTLPKLIAYFCQHPDQLNHYLPLNQRFVFFQSTHGAPAQGSLSVPVTAERSIATDKSLMPPGALALVQIQIPVASTHNEWHYASVNRYVLDQDTGGAITGPGRVDLFMGTGVQAGVRAGLINSTGRLYYLLLKD
ncbi:MAG: murein transglycosylase, partial [Cyanothece sp. SIO1E1]|nr:murein transglycosylase [Cyanothece sp. SIO1E1]